MSENQKHTTMKRALCTILVATQLTAAWFAPAQTNIDSPTKQRQSAIQINISPPQAVTAAGQWRVDGGAWQNSGAVVVGLIAGLHGLSFKPTAGWTTPTNRFVTLIVGQTNLSTGLYEPGCTNSVIAVSPSSLDLGSITVGGTGNLTFTVQNVGGGILTGAATASAPFSIVTGSPYVLRSSQNQVITVQYVPTVTGTNSTVVHLTGGGGTSIIVAGAGSTALAPSPPGNLRVVAEP